MKKIGNPQFRLCMFDILAFTVTLVIKALGLCATQEEEIVEDKSFCA